MFVVNGHRIGLERAGIFILQLGIVQIIELAFQNPGGIAHPGDRDRARKTILEHFNLRGVSVDRHVVELPGSSLEREEQIRLVQFRTGPKPSQVNLLPYVVEVVAADKSGILFQIAEFFQQHGISIEQLQSTRYRAMQTGADMFSAQITVGIPANTHIAALRDDFLEFCDGLNLDAIMDPMKY